MTVSELMPAYFQAMKEGRAAQALELIRQCRQLEPANPGLQMHEVLCLEANGKHGQALEQALSLAAEPVNVVPLLDQLAQLLIRYQRYEPALVLYQKASRLEPGRAIWQLSTAKVLQFLGRIAEANEAADRAVELDPGFAESWFFRSHLVRQSEKANHIGDLRRIHAGKALDPVGKAQVGFALAKELEDCQRFEESFAVRAAAARRYRSHLQYEVARDVRYLGRVASVFSSEQLAALPAPPSSTRAIFITGLPRSGTTLLERIIGSHDDVRSLGEITQFTRSMEQGLGKLGLEPEVSELDLVDASTRIDFAGVGDAYLESVSHLVGESPGFIDKLPQNALFAGPIWLALGGAVILQLERHPMDVCYSMFKQLFNSSFNFSYDLQELAAYYIAWDALMRHWQEVLPDRYRVVRYERLVQELETESRSVLEFCGLQWQDQCLEFHRNRQASTTASSSQVRKPVYSSSIGLWKNYSRQLEPLRQQLEVAGCLEGWES